MATETIPLWSEEERNVGSGSAIGTFHSGCPTLTWHPADSARNRGTIIVCPGGGYGAITPYEGIPVAEKLNAHGLNAYVLNYRVHPDLYPSPYQDIKRAIQLVRQRAEQDNLHTNRVAVMGFSAGGHLAASAGTMWDHESCRPDAMVLCYPVITFGKMGHLDSRINLLGDSAQSALASDLSIENRVDRRTSPTYLWHTADDCVVPVENTLLMASALSAKQVPFACHIYPSGVHGLGLAEDLPEIRGWFDEVVVFLNQFDF